MAAVLVRHHCRSDDVLDVEPANGSLQASSPTASHDWVLAASVDLGAVRVILRFEPVCRGECAFRPTIEAADKHFLAALQIGAAGGRLGCCNLRIQAALQAAGKQERWVTIEIAIS